MELKLSLLLQAGLIFQFCHFVTAGPCPNDVATLASVVQGYLPAQSYCTSKYPLAPSTTTATSTTTVTTTATTATVSTAAATTTTTFTAPPASATVTASPTTQTAAATTTTTIIASTTTTSTLTATVTSTTTVTVTGTPPAGQKKRGVTHPNTKVPTTSTTSAKAKATTTTTFMVHSPQQPVWSSILASASSVIGQICTCIESRGVVTRTNTVSVTTGITASTTVGFTATSTATVTPTTTISITPTITTTITTTVTSTQTNTATTVTTTTTTSYTTTTTYVAPMSTGDVCSMDTENNSDPQECGSNCACAPRVEGGFGCWEDGDCDPCNTSADCQPGSFCSDSPFFVGTCGSPACVNTNGCAQDNPGKRNVVENMFGWSV